MSKNSESMYERAVKQAQERRLPKAKGGEMSEIKGNSIRAVLEECRQVCINYECANEIGCKECIRQSVDSALASLAELVEKEKQGLRLNSSVEEQEGISMWNSCCDHIAKMIRGE